MTMLRTAALLALAALPASTLPARAQAADDPRATSDTKVEHVTAHGVAPTVGVVARASAAGTKTATALVETPQSISVVTRTQMDELDVQSIDQALAYTSGVGTNERGADGARYDPMTIRGFSGEAGQPDQYLDGLHVLNGSYYALQQLDPFLLDEVDVVKGPTSVVYGESNPGGIVAETSKLPTATALHSLLIEGGSFDTVRGVIDLGGPVTADRSLLYRFAATGMEGDTQLAGTKLRHYAFAPAVTWKPGSSTSITILGRYQRDPALGAYSAAPEVGSAIYDPLGKLNDDFYLGDPNDEIYNRTQASIGYLVDQTLDRDWRLHFGGRYAYVGSVTEGLYGDALESGSYSVLPRYTYGSKENVDTLAFDNQLLGHVVTGPLTHGLLFGISHEQTRDDYDYGGGTAPSLDIFDPVYGYSIAHPGVELADGQTTTDTGIYMQDQAKFQHWRLTWGVRQDWLEVATRDLIDSTESSLHSNKLTYRVGLLYLTDMGLAPYFNYATSFQPQSGTDYAGSAFAPTLGEQYEVGLKYQPKGFPGLLSAALYNLRESNVLASDAEHVGFEVATGAERSRGVELEGHLQIWRSLEAVASWTYQDVTYVAGQADLIGRRPGEVPANFASLWLHYVQKTGRLAGLGGGVGVRYVGNSNVLDTYGDAAEYTTAPYTLVDLRVEYELGHAFPAFHGASLAVNVTNLANAQYLTSCYSGLGCFTGADRDVSAQFRYAW